MTTEPFSEVPNYTVAGTGPYAIPHEYTSGAVKPVIEAVDADPVALDEADYTIDPDSGDEGNLTLSASAAATYDGAQIYLYRETSLQQGWVGQSGAREKGLERQLDLLAQGGQDALDAAGRSLRIARGKISPLSPADGRVPIWNEEKGGFDNGPSATEVAAAQSYAEEAKETAEQFGDMDTAISEAEDARDRSESWAEAPENTEVEAGKYSALHHAAKAAADAGGARAALDETKIVKDYIGGAVFPVGAVAIFPINNVPSTFLPMDGRAVTSETPDLRQVLVDAGAPWGSDGTGNPFLPDTRGEFIRGWDDGRGVDVGRTIGSDQDEALKAHHHRLWSADVSSGTVYGFGASAPGVGGGNNLGTGAFYEDGSSGHQLVEDTGGTETRPRNIAMIYAIKAFHAHADLTGKLIDPATVAETTQLKLDVQAALAETQLSKEDAQAAQAWAEAARDGAELAAGVVARATSVAGLTAPGTLAEGDSGLVSGSGSSAVDGIYQVQSGAWVRVLALAFASASQGATAEASALALRDRARTSDFLRLLADLGQVEAQKYAGENQIPLLVLRNSEGADISPVYYDLKSKRLVVNAIAQAPVALAIGKTISALEKHGDQGPVSPFHVDAAGTIVEGWDKAQNKPYVAGVHDQLWTAGPVFGEWTGLFGTGQSFMAGAYGFDELGEVVTQAPRYANLTFGSGERSARPGGAFEGDANGSPGTATTIPLIASDTAYGTELDHFGESQGPMLCDRLSEIYAEAGIAPTERILFWANAAIGGNSIEMLHSSVKKAWAHEQLQDFCTRAAAAGKAPVILANAHSQGEQDIVLGTPRAEWKAETLRYFREWDAAAMAASGQVFPPAHFVWQTDAAGDATLITTGQLELAEETPLVFNVSPNYPFPRTSNANTHPTAYGYQWMGAYTARAIETWKRTRRAPPVCKPVGAVYDPAANEVRIRYVVPKPPLVLDQVSLGTIVDEGIRVTDDGVAASLGAVSILGDDTVVVPISGGALTGEISVRIGYDHGGSALVTPLTATSIRDSTPDVTWIPAYGAAMPMYHWSMARVLTPTRLERS
ncbi:MAG: hypothetical protein GYB51_01600 [Rhodobacteraceae bacterium]|nr:hypothetical protein [Paracoccaceae bacterium]